MIRAMKPANVPRIWSYMNYAQLVAEHHDIVNNQLDLKVLSSALSRFPNLSEVRLNFQSVINIVKYLFL